MSNPSAYASWIVDEFNYELERLVGPYSGNEDLAPFVVTRLACPDLCPSTTRLLAVVEAALETVLPSLLDDASYQQDKSHAATDPQAFTSIVRASIRRHILCNFTYLVLLPR